MVEFVGFGGCIAVVSWRGSVVESRTDAVMLDTRIGIKTDMEIVDDFPLLDVAVILVVPFVSGITIPDGFIVATAVLLLAHVTVLSVVLSGKITA
jgi:hypothetical protein